MANSDLRLISINCIYITGSHLIINGQADKMSAPQWRIAYTIAFCYWLLSGAVVVTSWLFYRYSSGKM